MTTKKIGVVLGLMTFLFSFLPIQASSSTDISNATEFVSMNDPFGHYTLSQDIDFTGISPVVLFDSTNPFQGTLDGNGYTLKNLTYEWVDGMSTKPLGLISYSKNAVFKNINLVNFNVSVASSVNVPEYAGLLVGNAVNTEFTQITILKSSLISQAMMDVGGLVGTGSDGSFSDIVAYVKLRNASGYLGGILGSYSISTNTSLELSQIDATVDLEGGNHTGGIIGAIYGKDSDPTTQEMLILSQVSSKGTLTGINNLGGIAGELILEHLTVSDVTSASLSVTRSSTETNLHFSGLIASAEVDHITLNRVLVQSPLIDEFYTSLSADAISDLTTSNIDVIQDSYYIADCGFTSTQATALNSTQSINSTSYTNYDFTTTWAIHPLFNEGIPYLRTNLAYLNYDTQGGSLVSTQPFFKYDVIPQPTNPTKEGYSFDGWYQESSATSLFDFNDVSHSTNQTLYAKWVLIPQVQTTTIVTAANEPLPKTGVKHNSISILMSLILGCIVLILGKSK